MAYYWLTPPSRAVSSFQCCSRFSRCWCYAHVAIPVVSSHSFETLLIAFLLLLTGNVQRLLAASLAFGLWADRISGQSDVRRVGEQIHSRPVIS
jgi:hypothetical protein